MNPPELEAALAFTDDPADGANCERMKDFCRPRELEASASRRILAAEVRRLQAELAKAKEDKERLDWLDGDGRCAKFSDGWNTWSETQLRPIPTFIRKDIRDAIDAARKAK